MRGLVAHTVAFCYRCPYVVVYSVWLVFSSIIDLPHSLSAALVSSKYRLFLSLFGVTRPPQLKRADITCRWSSHGRLILHQQDTLSTFGYACFSRLWSNSRPCCSTLCYIQHFLKINGELWDQNTSVPTAFPSLKEVPSLLPILLLFGSSLVTYSSLIT